MADSKLIDQIVSDAKEGRNATDKSGAYDNIFKEVSQVIAQDGGVNTPECQKSLHQVNEKLHTEGILPGLNIVGADPTSNSLLLSNTEGFLTSQHSGTVETKQEFPINFYQQIDPAILQKLGK